ncbi:MAG: hypothetical protein ABFD07_20160 [Methanobacterium sp.]
MKKFLTVVAVLISLPVAAEDYSSHDELFMANQAGGVVALTVEPCAVETAKIKHFDMRAYATEADGTRHEGCWMAPDISEAPNHPSVKIIPIVNVWFDGIIVPFEQGLFAPMIKVNGGV